jgi:hypothetical protein
MLTLQNIFPIAQKAIIEETIGINRPSASPPLEQTTSECSVRIRKGSIRINKPTWFKLDSLSEKEKNMLKDLKSSYFK